jgi:DNA repair protein RecO
MIVKTDGIILRGRRVRETSVHLVVYSEMYGKIPLMVKGVRQMKSRLRGIVEPFNEVSVVVYRREHREMHYLSQVDLLRARIHLTSNFDALSDAFAIAELVDTVAHDEERNSELYVLLRSALIELDTPSTPDHNVVLRFQCDLARVLGYGLRADLCVQCGNPIPEGMAVWFIPEEGGVNCDACHTAHPAGTKVSFAVYNALFSLLHSPRSVSIDRVSGAEVRSILNRYLLHHSGSHRQLRASALRPGGT